MAQPPTPPTPPTPAGGGNIDASVSAFVTPNRRTVARFDVPETVVVDDTWEVIRMRGEIAPAAAQASGTSGQFSHLMRFWKCGCWTLIPAQTLLAEVQEAPRLSDVMAGVATALRGFPVFSPESVEGQLRLTVAPGVTSRKGFSKFPPASPSALVNETGDTFLRKNVQAANGGNLTGVLGWAQTVASPVPTPLLSPPTATVPDAPVLTPPAFNTPMDRIWEGQVNLPADAGLFLRFTVPGSLRDHPDRLLALHWAQFAITFLGDGHCVLTEWAQPRGGGAYRWAPRQTFRFAERTQVANAEHTIMIFPVTGPNGERYINFAGGSVGGNINVLQHASETASSREFVYISDPLMRGGDVDDAPPGVVCIAGPVRLDVRRDLRMDAQLSPLLFIPFGQLRDTAVNGPSYTVPRPLHTFMICDPYTDTGEAGYIRMYTDKPDGSTGWLKIGDTQNNLQYWPGSDNCIRPAPLFTFIGGEHWPDYEYSKRTPVLWGYRMNRSPVYQDIAPGTFEANVTSVQLSGDEGDPRQVGGQVVIQDPVGALTRLRRRGYLTANVRVYFIDPATGQEQFVNLFRGSAIRPKAKQLGKYDVDAYLQAGVYQNVTHGGIWNDQTAPNGTIRAPRDYPSTEWREFDVALTGMHERVSTKSARSLLTMRSFGLDESQPKEANGAALPWRVTDAIKFMLGAAGFPDSMIAIADSPIRLYAGIDSVASAQMIDGNTNLLERCVTFARNYLGAYLIFDACYGTRGAWRLVVPPPPGTPPVFHFTRFPASVTAPPHLPEAYPANTTFTIGDAQTYVSPPDMNHLVVFTAAPTDRLGSVRIDKHFYNHDSYPVPLSTRTPNADNPHWVGHELGGVVAMPELWGGQKGTGGYRRTEAALMFVGRRLFDFACRARVIAPITCPLPILKDPQTGLWRTLRFGDPVTLDGEPEWGKNDWFVRSCAPSYTSDTLQLANVQLEKSVPYPWVP